MHEPLPRPELDWESLPSRMRTLPIDARGYPVPWFVDWIDGVPEFRAMDPQKWQHAVRDKRCWVCGVQLGKHLTFVIGPMCAINRTTIEPPCHTDCAEWSAKNCPFLSRPKMVRREDELFKEAQQHVAGEMIARNPGVTLLWTTRSYRVYPDRHRRPLIEIGEPTAVAWYREGRAATRAEVVESIDTGLPFLLDTLRLESEADRPAALREIQTRRASIEALFPAA